MYIHTYIDINALLPRKFELAGFILYYISIVLVYDLNYLNFGIHKDQIAVYMYHQE